MKGRSYRAHEVYELRCHTCYWTVELPVSSVRGHLAQCPRCAAKLEIFWGEAS